MEEHFHYQKAKANPALLSVVLFAMMVLTVSVILFVRNDQIRDNGIEPVYDSASERIDGAGFQEALTEESQLPADRVEILGEKRPQSPLNRKYSIHGIVLAAGGSPAEGSAVMITRLSVDNTLLSPSRYKTVKTRCDEDGRFFFNSVPGGSYNLVATKGAQSGVMLIYPGGFHEPGGVDRLYEVILRPSGSISGFVTGPDGDPIAGAIVTPYKVESARARTDQAGRFVLNNLQIGRHTVYVQADGFSPRSMNSILTGTTDALIQLSLGGRISGTVTLDDSPVPNIIVIAIPTHKALFRIPFETVSGPEGRYIFDHLPEGSYHLGAASEHLSSTYKRELLVVEGEELAGVDFNLLRNGSVSGRVTASDTGEPIAGALIQSYNLWYRLKYSGSNSYLAVTDSNGCYTLPSLPPGRPPVCVRAHDIYAGAIKEEVEIESSRNTADVDFKLIRSASVDLFLRTESGEPVSNAQLSLRWEYRLGGIMVFDPFPAPEQVAEGHYVLRGLCPGDFDIIVERLKVRRGNQSFTIESPGESKTYELVLSPGMEITGKVMAPDGSGVANTFVDFRAQRKCLTDEQGFFRMDGIFSGPNQITIDAKGYRRYLKWFKVEDETAPLEFTLEAEGAHFLAGNAVNDLGDPISELHITSIQMVNDVETKKTVYTDKDGRFRIDGLVEGTTELKLQPNRGRPRGDCRKIPVDTNDLELVLVRFAQAKGRVLGPDGEPVKEFTLYAYTMNTGRVPPMSFTSDDGTFHIPRVLPGEVNFQAYSDGLGNGVSGPYAINPGGTLENIEVVLQAFAMITGVVREKETLKPIQGAKVSSGERLGFSRHRLEQYGYEYMAATTDEDGSFVIKNLEPATLTVAAFHSDYCVGVKKEVKVVRGETTSGIEILLSRGSTIQGHVYIDGRAAPGVFITGRHTSGHDEIRSETKEDGSYQLDYVTPGSYRITANSSIRSGTNSMTVRAEVKDGEVKNCDITFTGSASVEGTVTMFMKPVERTRVSVYSKKSGNGIEMGGNSLSNMDGYYRIDGLSPGLYNITASYRKGKKELVTRDELEVVDGVTIRNFALEGAGFGELSGYIYNNNQPICKTRVSLDTGSGYRQEYTENGYFKFTEVPAGVREINIRYSPEGATCSHILKRDIEIKPNVSLEERFDFMTGSGELAGSVTCNGAPVDRATLYLYRDSGTSGESSHSDAYTIKGAYHATGLQPGMYWIYLGSPWLMRQIVEIKNGMKATADFAYEQGDAVLAGTVTAPSDWENDGLSAICLFKPGACPWEIGGPSKTSSLSEGMVARKRVFGGGDFKQQELPPGNFDMVAILTKDDKILNMKVTPITLRNEETTEVHIDLMTE